MAEIYAYSPYGKANQASAVGNPYLFTGRRYDPETGLFYYRARYYDAESGRFLQVDPIGYVGGINLYAYCLNDPVNLIDPLGLAWRQKRPLDVFGLRHITAGTLHHDRLLFDDGAESGFYGDSRVTDDPASQKLKDRYKNVGEYLQDDILRDAVNNVKPKWDYSKDSLVNEYDLLNHNCQDYVNAVLKEYDRLKREKENANPCKQKRV